MMGTNYKLIKTVEKVESCLKTYVPPELDADSIMSTSNLCDLQESGFYKQPICLNNFSVHIPINYAKKIISTGIVDFSKALKTSFTFFENVTSNINNVFLGSHFDQRGMLLNEGDIRKKENPSVKSYDAISHHSKSLFHVTSANSKIEALKFSKIKQSCCQCFYTNYDPSPIRINPSSFISRLGYFSARGHKAIHKSEEPSDCGTPVDPLDEDEGDPLPLLVLQGQGHPLHQPGDLQNAVDPLDEDEGDPLPLVLQGQGDPPHQPGDNAANVI